MIWSATRADVDLVPVLLPVHRPDRIDGIVPVRARRALDRDDGRLQLSAEKVLVQHAEQLLKLTGKAARFCDLFHFSRSFC
jgi:hypothetical protein